MDRIPTIPAPAVRLHAWYRSAGALLRELSRALNRGRTLLRADSGLPVGTHLVLVMSTDGLSAPLQIQGTVTSCRTRGHRHEMTLRYDFDAASQRAGLNEALAELRRETRRPRRVPRVPLRLATNTTPLSPDLEVTVTDASPRGARLRMAGPNLPELEEGSRLVLRHQGERPGTRRPLRVELEARWLEPKRGSRGSSSMVVGGRFTHLSDAMKKRLRALLRFEETRPRVSLVALRPPAVGKTGQRSRRRKKAARKR